MTQITAVNQAFDLLVPAGAKKDKLHRLSKFAHWQGRQSPPWYAPDLASYRDGLLQDYEPSTVSAHLATVRAHYKTLLRDRDLFFEIAARECGPDASRADLKATADEYIARLTVAIDPKAAPVKQITKQDRADSEHLRLTSEQANSLMGRPGVTSLKRLRDTAIIALMLCTGLREAELCALTVDDLRQRYGGELSLLVREGKGAKQRLIPYGPLSWVLVIIDTWLEKAGIDSGFVFRGFWKPSDHDQYTTRPGPLTPRQIQRLLASYPLVKDGTLTQVRPHDLRRTYARRLYDSGIDLLSIKENLGHKSPETTLGYIGTLDASKRRPPAIYHYDLTRLKGQLGLFD